MEKIKWLASVVAGMLATFTRQYAAIILFVAVAVVLDWITGCIKAQVTGEGLNSKKATIGFWKKVALFVGLSFGFYLDYFIPYMLQYVNVEMPINALFGMIVGCYIVINEAISICENLYATDPEILPKWIVTILAKTKHTIEQMEDDTKEVEEDGNN